MDARTHRLAGAWGYGITDRHVGIQGHTWIEIESGEREMGGGGGGGGTAPPTSVHVVPVFGRPVMCTPTVAGRSGLYPINTYF